MTSIRGAATLACTAALAFAAAGCGGADSEDEEPPAGSVETTEEVRNLPQGWTTHRNPQAGFEIGVPPGWDAEDDGIRTTVRSPDRLVAATIFADRSDEAVELPLDEFAQSAITSVGGFEELEPEEVRRFEHRYEAVAIEASGVGDEKGIEQELLLVVVRRAELATFTVLVARNAERASGRFSDEVERMIRSLRSRPVA